jgi:hypothetical protein
VVPLPTVIVSPLLLSSEIERLFPLPRMIFAMCHPPHRICIARTGASHAPNSAQTTKTDRFVQSCIGGVTIRAHQSFVISRQKLAFLSHVKSAGQQSRDELWITGPQLAH